MPQFENGFDNVLEFVEKSEMLDTEITFEAIEEVDKVKMEELAKNRKVKLKERLYSPSIL
jgi:hypothetical protein